MKLFNNSLAKFQKEALEIHNNYRKFHRAPPLVWSDKLAHNAAKWAERLSILGIIQNEDNQKEGENIYFTTNEKVNANIAVKKWYDESKKYNYSSDEQQLDAGHFTQLVWCETKKFGISYVQKKGNTYVVARYFPAGNIRGLFGVNVKPLVTKMSDILGDEDDSNGSNFMNYKQITKYILKDPVEPEYKETITKDFPYLEHYRATMLELHNSARVYHKTNPLILDENLCDFAQNFAEKLLNFKIGKTEKPEFNDSKMGKSIAYVVGQNLPDPKSVCSNWYAGIRFYDFEQQKFNDKNGGFTQMIWKNTTYVGFGVFWGENRSVIVAFYDPPGNIQGYFEKNVNPPDVLKKETIV